MYLYPGKVRTHILTGRRRRQCDDGRAVERYSHARKAVLSDLFKNRAGGRRATSPSTAIADGDRAEFQGLDLKNLAQFARAVAVLDKDAATPSSPDNRRFVGQQRCLEA